MTKEQLAQLSAPFPDGMLSVKPQSYNKERTEVMLVLYLAHTDVATRLDQVDPAWSFSMEPYIREQGTSGSVFTITGSLTIAGVTRMNVGEGNDPKSAASDCLKRCAMLFGVGRSLYESEPLRVPYNQSNDKYKKWSIEEYRAASRTRPNSQPAVGNVSPKVIPQPAGASRSTGYPAPTRAPVTPKSAPVKPQSEFDMSFEDSML